MVDGAKYIVTESMTEVIDRIAAYRARVISLAHTVSASQPPHAGWQLGLVPDSDSDADTSDGEPSGPAIPLHPRKI